MIAVQVVLTVLAVRLHGKKAAVPAGLLAVACLASVVSGFFDGGLGNDELTTALVGVPDLPARGHRPSSAYSRARLVEILR